MKAVKMCANRMDAFLYFRITPGLLQAYRDVAFRDPYSLSAHESSKNVCQQDGCISLFQDYTNVADLFTYRMDAFPISDTDEAWLCAYKMYAFSISALYT